MAKKDYGGRETRKPKKDGKRPSAPATLAPPSPEPQVIVRKRLPREEP